jgi:hypothetical protein
LNLWELPQTAHIEMDGGTRVRKLARLPVRLPLGYHEISVEAAGASAAVRFIVTPERAWVSPHLGRGGRTAGIAVSLYGVRSARNWGCGDFGDLLQVVDFAAEQLECGFVALNPLHAIHNRRPVQHQPVSAELHVLPEFSLPRRREHGGFRALPPRAATAEFARGGGRDRRSARRSVRGIRARERAQAALPQIAVRAVSARAAHAARRAPANSRPTSTARAICWKNSPPMRARRASAPLDPDAWIWPHWPAPTRTRNRRRRARSAANIGAA